MQLEIIYCTVGEWQENSYLIKYKSQAWLVDPGDEFENLDKKFALEELCLKGIINTHGHFDHLGAVHQFKKKYNTLFYIHSKDKQIVRQANLYKKLAGSSSYFVTPAIDGFLDEQASFKLDDKVIKVHSTPGHTNGSVSFEIDNALISGDLLFKEAIGRVDLPGGNIDLLKRSITYIIEKFEGYTIYPGHGSPFVLDGRVIDTLSKLI